MPIHYVTTKRPSRLPKDYKPPYMRDYKPWESPVPLPPGIFFLVAPDGRTIVIRYVTATGPRIGLAGPHALPAVQGRGRHRRRQEGRRTGIRYAVEE